MIYCIVKVTRNVLSRIYGTLSGPSVVRPDHVESLVKMVEGANVHRTELVLQKGYQTL